MIESFSIGIPGFFLALAPNDKLVKKGYLDRVLRFSLPSFAGAAAATFAAYAWARDGRGPAARRGAARRRR